jgi:hypothetical protein
VESLKKVYFESEAVLKTAKLHVLAGLPALVRLTAVLSRKSLASVCTQRGVPYSGVESLRLWGTRDCVVSLILMDPCKVVFLDETNETDITDAGLVINEEL